MWICKTCSATNEPQFGSCWRCGLPKPEATNTDRLDESKENDNHDYKSIRHLRAISIIGLVAGIVGAIYWLFNLQKPVLGSSRKEIDPLAVGLAFASTFQGVITYVVFSAVASIAENVIIIKRKIIEKE